MRTQIQALVTEQFDDISYRVLKMRERWDNRHVFPLSKVRESYLSGHLHLYFVCKVIDKTFLVHIRGAAEDCVEADFGANEHTNRC